MKAIFVYFLVWINLNLLILNHNIVDAEPLTATAAFGIATNVMTAISFMWEIVDKIENDDNKIFEGMEVISRDIKDLEVSIIATQQCIKDLKSFITKNAKFEQLEDLIFNFNFFYNTYENYLERHVDLERDTLENFAYNVVQDSSSSVKGYLKKIHALMFDRGLLKIMSDELKNSEGSCAENRSHQQVLYQLYNTIQLIEVKSYTMIEFSYMILKSHGKGNYTTETDIFRKNVETRMINARTQLKQAIQNTNRTIWRCDPKEHVEGETFLQLTKMLQGVFERVDKLNANEHCYQKSCDDYTMLAVQSYNKQNCNGKYYNCLRNGHGEYAETCPAPPNSTRRYEYAEIYAYNDLTFGYLPGKKKKIGEKNNSCKQPMKKLKLLRRFFGDCKICFCICDAQGSDSDRFFSLRESISNVDKNMIVTGIRFFKKNRIFHLQVQEGELLENGQVNSSNTRWVPLSDSTISDGGTKQGIDYHTMTHEKRHLDLDDLRAPKDYVVTGVRFRMVGIHLNLQMRVSKIDFVRGMAIEPEKSYWIGNDNTESTKGSKRREEVGLYLPDIPTKSNISIPLSTNNTYIKFTFSDLDKDVSQTTVPFLDAQDVVNDPPVPLEGIGIFLKGQEGFGGFIAPKIFTFDYNDYV